MYLISSIVATLVVFVGLGASLPPAVAPRAADVGAAAMPPIFNNDTLQELDVGDRFAIDTMRRPATMIHPDHPSVFFHPTWNREVRKEDLDQAVDCLAEWCDAHRVVLPQSRIRCRAGKAVAYVCNWGNQNPCSLQEMVYAREEIHNYTDSPTGWWDNQAWAKVYGFDLACAGLYADGTPEPRCNLDWEFGFGEPCGSPTFFDGHWQYDGRVASESDADGERGPGGPEDLHPPQIDPVTDRPRHRPTYVYDKDG